jgi:hypothetical protein
MYVRPARQEREEGESIFEEIIKGNFSKLVKNIKP